MAESPNDAGFFIDQSGETVQIPTEQMGQALQLGYVPASDKQIEEYQKVQKYSTTGQQAKTFAEGAGQSLTLGLSTLGERALGVDPEDIKNREEINPNAHLAGSLTGVAAPLVISGGASLLGEGAAGAAKLTAPSLISHVGEAAAELLPEEAHSLAGRVALSAGRGLVTGATEGSLQSVGHIVHEAALGDPNLTAQSAMEEVGLSALLGGAVGGGAGLLGGLTKEAAGSEMGQKLVDWANNFEGNQNIKSAAGPGGGRSALRGLYKKMSPEEASKLGQEAGEMGLVTPFTKPADSFERAQEVMGTAGKKMGDILGEADAGAAPAPIEDIMSRARKEILAPLEGNPLEQSTANKLKSVLDAYEDKFGSQADTTAGFKDLHSIRKEVSDKIYGLRGVADPEANAMKSSLHEFRSMLSDEINKGLESADLPKASLEAWKQASREYQVAATVSGIAEKGMTAAGLSGVPLSAILTSGAGLIHGGPLGAAALGLGTMAAKRYGPGVLAAGARGLRKFINEAGAESVVEKTAEMIAQERSAAVSEGVSLASDEANKISAALSRAAEKAEPLIAPTKDVIKDRAQDSIKEAMVEKREGASAPEAIAALSQLQKANDRVNERVKELAGKVASGKKAGETGRAASIISTEEYQKKTERLQQLASNPDLMQQHLTTHTRDLREHAPNVADAYGVTASRAVRYLNEKFPPSPKPGPLAPALKPSKSQLQDFSRATDMISKPSLLLKHAAAGTLRPSDVEAIRQVAPERLAHMQAALLEHLTNGAKPPYSSRLPMAILMGRDLDGTMSQASIAATQAVFHRPSAKGPDSQTGPGATGKSNQTGMGKLMLSSNMDLPGQSASKRASRGE